MLMWKPTPGSNGVVAATVTLAAMTLALSACDRPADVGREWSSGAGSSTWTGQQGAVHAGQSRLLLAWRATDESANVQSVLLRDDGTGFHEASKGSKAALFAQGKLWFVDLVAVPHREVDCGCAPLAGFSDVVSAKCVVTGQTERAVLTSEGTKRQWLGLDAAASRDLTDAQLVGESDLSFELYGSFGALVLGAVCEYSMACGAAHGSHACRPVVWDAAKARPVELLNKQERGRTIAVLRIAAAVQLGLRDPEVAVASAVSLARVGVQLSRHGRLEGVAVFAGDSSYADSSDWAAYRAVQEVVMPRLPHRLEAYARIPNAVRRIWSQRPTRFGWSSLELSSKEADEIVGQFSKHAAHPAGSRPRRSR